MSRVSIRTTNTRLFKEKEILGISYCWETKDHVVFERCETDDLINDYYLMEVFNTGEIMVTDKNGVVIDKTDRILNLFRLNI